MSIDICGEITAGFTPDCDNPIIAGATDRLILFNFDDIDTFTFGARPGVISGITLKSGKSGYAWVGQNRSVEPRVALVRGRYSNQFDHESTFKVFGNSPEVKEQLNKMVNGRYLAIVENNFKGNMGDAAFELQGIRGGVEVAELERITADADTEGAYNVIMRSSEFGREAKLPKTIWDTDYNTTKALIEALINAPIVFNVEPTALAVLGGDSVIVTGENFTGVTQVDFIDQALAITNQAVFTVDNDGQISFTSVALTAGTYKIRLTSPDGTGESLAVLTAS